MTSRVFNGDIALSLRITLRFSQDLSDAYSPHGWVLECLFRSRYAGEPYQRILTKSGWDNVGTGSFEGRMQLHQEYSSGLGLSLGVVSGTWHSQRRDLHLKRQFSGFLEWNHHLA